MTREPEPTAGADPKTAPRYTGIPSFMRTPVVDDPAQTDIALVGVPFDGGVTNRPGARHGPREMRNASSLTRRMHHVTRVDPYALCRVADVGDVPFTHGFHLEESLADIAGFLSRVHAAGAVPLVAGGDHSITLPVLRALAAERPVALVHVDAHTDTWDSFLGSKFVHGSPFRRAAEEGLIDPARTIQIGIRGAQNAADGWDYSAEAGMTVMFMEEFEEVGPEAAAARARELVGERPVYVSFDIDVLDPAFAPGTGTPEIGGMTTREALCLVRGLRGLDLIGADVVEVSPPFDPSGGTALAGATIMYELLCHLAEAVTARR